MYISMTLKGIVHIAKTQMLTDGDKPLLGSHTKGGKVLALRYRMAAGQTGYHLAHILRLCLKKARENVKRHAS